MTRTTNSFLVFFLANTSCDNQGLAYMILHFMVAAIATTLGAMAGLGGGVIIKPVLDSLGIYTISTVGLLSSITVFSMAVVSVIKQSINGFQFQRQILFLSAGAIAGGVFGKEFFSFFVQQAPDESIALCSQSFLLAGLLTFVCFINKIPRFHITNRLVITGTGCFLGFIASFLGIGGGPINVAVLVVLLGLNTKDAAINSIFIILLSQLSKLSWLLVTEGVGDHSLVMLDVMIPGAIVGSLVGSQLNRVLSVTRIETVFSSTLVALILLNLCNGFSAIL